MVESVEDATAEELSVASDRALVAPRAALPAALDDVEDLAAAFLLGQGTATVAAYRADLADFGQFLASIGVEALAVRRAHVDAYAHRLRALGASDATIARRLACLSGFYRYALEEGLLERNPVAGVRRPRLSEDSQALGLDRDQTRALLGAPTTHPRATARSSTCWCSSGCGSPRPSASTSRTSSRRAGTRPCG